MAGVVVYKVAVLIDGGFYKQRHKSRSNGRFPDAKQVDTYIQNLIKQVQKQSSPFVKDVLFRTYYYDAKPYAGTEREPNGNELDFSKTTAYTEATKFLDELAGLNRMMLRLGELSFDGWKIDGKNHRPDFKQKSVDMMIGLDIAYMANKQIVDKVVLVTADSDFAIPLDYAQKEGLVTYLDPMGTRHLKKNLTLHADYVL